MTRTEELHAALRLADWEGAYTVRTLMADTLQAERDEAVALLRETFAWVPGGEGTVGDYATAGLRGRVRAFLGRAND